MGNDIRDGSYIGDFIFIISLSYLFCFEGAKDRQKVEFID